MLRYKGYTGVIEIDERSGLFTGRVNGIRTVITFQGETVQEIIMAFRESVDTYLKFCKQRKETPEHPQLLKVGFDVGGVLSKYPQFFRQLIRKMQGIFDIYIISDMKDVNYISDTLLANGFDIPIDHIHGADYDSYGEACKAVLLKELNIDVFIDDHFPYVSTGCPLRLLVLPDITMPYYDDSWKGPVGEFGRRGPLENAAARLSRQDT